MANKSFDDDLSMDSYFEDDSYDAESPRPQNPFEEEPPRPLARSRKGKPRSSKRSKRAAIGRRVLIILCVVVAISLTIGIVIYVKRRKNDGARHAQKLALSIGSPLMDAQQNADQKLQSVTKYPALGALLTDYAGLLESTKETKVQGVHLPEWLICCQAKDGVLSSVVFFDYRMIEENAFGTERKSYLDPHTVTTANPVERVEEQLGLSPFSVCYKSDRTVYREYRYWYEDAETADLTAYTISAKWNADGKLESISDARVDVLSSVLRMQSTLNQSVSE